MIAIIENDSKADTAALFPQYHTWMHILDRPEDIVELRNLIRHS